MPRSPLRSAAAAERVLRGCCRVGLPVRAPRSRRRLPRNKGHPRQQLPPRREERLWSRESHSSSKSNSPVRRCLLLSAPARCAVPSARPAPRLPRSRPALGERYRRSCFSTNCVDKRLLKRAGKLHLISGGVKYETCNLTVPEGGGRGTSLPLCFPAPGSWLDNLG